MNILIFGGTTESRDLSRRLADAGGTILVSVVSEYGARQQGEHPGITVLVGPKGPEEMADMLRDMDLVIDATHPYAAEASVNIRRAASDAGVRRIRLRREEDTAWNNPQEEELSRTILWSEDREEAARIAAGKAGESKGNILLTTGVRDLPFYCERLDMDRLYARVLPSAESIAICRECGLDPKNIIAIQGPFSAQLNAALINEYHIGVIITKESGRTGGFREKLQACRSCGIPAVVIARPEDKGMSYDEVCEEVLRELKEIG